MIISYYRHREDIATTRDEVSWDEVAAGLATARKTACTVATCRHSDCEHKNGPAWSPAEYAAGATRHLANVESVHALVIDIDHVRTDADLGAQLAKLARYRRVEHSSHSDRPGDRCLRVVLALSEPVPGREWPRFWSAALAKLGIEASADPVCRDASRIYFLPSRPGDAPYHYERHEGEALDADAILASAPPVVYASRVRIDVPEFKGAPSPEARAEAARKLGAAWPGQGRHVAHLALSGALTRGGWPAELVADFCAAVAEVQQPGNSDCRKRLDTATNGRRRLEAGDALTGWPTLIGLLDPISVSDDGSLVEPGAGRVVQPAEVVSEIQTKLGLSNIPERDDAFFEALRAAAAPRGTWTGDLAAALAEIRDRLASGDRADHAPAPLFAMTARELLATRFPPSVWLVHGLITDGGCAVIATEPKSAKTWAATEIAIAVSTGSMAFGEFATVAPRQVAYFYAEDFGQQIQNRIRALLAGRGATEPPDGLHLQPRGRFLDVTRDDDLALMVASCRRLGKLDLLVLDPLRDVHSGEEDSSDSMSDVMRRLRLLGELLGCTVLVVHHTAKSGGDTSKRRPGQRMRGSGAIHGSIDSGIYLSDLRGDGRAEFTNQVQSEVKGARSAGAFDLTLSLRDDEGGAAVHASWRVERTESGKPGKATHDLDAEDDRRVLAKVRELAAAGHEPLSKSALREVVPGVPDQRARAAIKRLVGKELEIGTACTTEGRVLRDRVLLVGLGRVGG